MKLIICWQNQKYIISDFQYLTLQCIEQHASNKFRLKYYLIQLCFQIDKKNKIKITTEQMFDQFKQIILQKRAGLDERFIEVYCEVFQIKVELIQQTATCQQIKLYKQKQNKQERPVIYDIIEYCANKLSFEQSTKQQQLNNLQIGYQSDESSQEKSISLIKMVQNEDCNDLSCISLVQILGGIQKQKKQNSVSCKDSSNSFTNFTSFSLDSFLQQSAQQSQIFKKQKKSLQQHKYQYQHSKQKQGQNLTSYSDAQIQQKTTKKLVVCCLQKTISIHLFKPYENQYCKVLNNIYQQFQFNQNQNQKVRISYLDQGDDIQIFIEEDFKTFVMTFQNKQQLFMKVQCTKTQIQNNLT